MSARLVVGCVALAALVPANAAAKPKQLTGGPLVALHIAGLGGDATLDLAGTPVDASPASRERFGVGAFVSFAVSDQLGLRAEMLYSQRGANNEGAAADGSFYKVQYDQTVVAVPVVVQWLIPYDDEITPRLFGGVEVVIVIDSTFDSEAVLFDMDNMPQPFDDSYDLEDDTAGVDVAAVIGAGMGMPVGRGNLVLDLRYAIGVATTIDAHEIRPVPGVVYTADSLRSHTFSLVASYEL